MTFNHIWDSLIQIPWINSLQVVKTYSRVLNHTNEFNGYRFISLLWHCVTCLYLYSLVDIAVLPGWSPHSMISLRVLLPVGKETKSLLEVISPTFKVCTHSPVPVLEYWSYCIFYFCTSELLIHSFGVYSLLKVWEFAVSVLCWLSFIQAPPVNVKV